VAVRSCFAHEGWLDKDLLFQIDSESLQTPNQLGIEPADFWTEDQNASHSAAVG